MRETSSSYTLSRFDAIFNPLSLPRFNILNCAQPIPAWYEHGRAPVRGTTSAAQCKRPTKRGLKGKRDTRAPKKALNAYNFYLREQMERIKKHRPSASTADALRSVATRWKKLAAEGRRPYESLVDDDKARLTYT